MPESKQGLGLQVTSLTIARFIPIFGALAVSVTLTRILTQAEYGHYRSIWLLFLLAGPVISSSLNNALYHRGEKKSFSNPVRAVVLLSVIAGIVLGSIISFGAPFWAETLHIPHLITAIQFFGIYVMLLIVSGMAEPVFMLIERKKWLLGYNLISQISEYSFIVIPFLMGYSITEVMGFMLIFPLLRMIFLIWLIFSHTNQATEIPAEVKKISSYSFGLFMMGIAGYAAYQMDTWIVRIFTEDDALFALFEIGARKIPLIGAVTSAVSSTLILTYSQLTVGGDEKPFLHQIKRSSTLLMQIAVPVLIVLFLFAEEVLIILYQKYAAAAPVFRIYLVIVLTNFIFADVYLLAKGKSREVARVSWAELTLNLVLSITFFKIWGWMGPAFASLSGHILYVLLCFRLARNYGDVHLRDFLPENIIFTFSVYCIVSYLFMIVCNLIFPEIISFFVVLFSVSALVGIQKRAEIKDFIKILTSSRA